jgi:predicted glycogen debranching enzyme
LGDGPGAVEDFAAVDAPLWYVEAVAAFAARGHDVKPLRNAVFAILEAFERGTSFDIREGADGLLQHGPSARPLTWMDAVAHDRPVTPREGCAVEVNALWYNALLRGAGLCASEDEAAPLRERAERCREAFDAFWWEDAGWLVDVMDAGGHADRSLRPNQLLAVSLPHPVVTGERAMRIVSAVERLLLVPTGVRTLAPGMDGYDGRCHGPLTVREGRRHNGAAWPAWMAPFIVGYLRVHDGDGAARRRVRDLLLRAEEWLSLGALGHIVERTCGDAPHLPDGNLASAWSTASILEALAALQDAELAAEMKPHALSLS